MSAGDRDDERTDRDEPAGGPPDGPPEAPAPAGEADAWAAIVANYGERAVLDDEPGHAAPVQPPQPEPETHPGPRPAAVVEPDDEEEGYVPPPPPPAPRPRGVRGAAWCGVLLAPALLLLVAVTEIGPRWTPVVLVAWFLAGFGYLVATMPREPREPWDDGAQVEAPRAGHHLLPTLHHPPQDPAALTRLRRMSVHETVELSGHLIDSGILSHVLEDIREYGGDWTIDRFDVGHEAADLSHATITVSAEDDEALQRLLMRLQTRGVNQVDPGEASVAEAEVDGVFPDGFYSTTNLETRVRLGGRWLEVENPEMDCGLVVERSADGSAGRVYTLPMSDVRRGMQVVCGASGIKVTVPVVDRSEESFGFMDSDVSSEKPQAVLVRQVADGMREARAAGRKVLWVGGPGVVHTGAAPAMVAMVEAGFVDILFAGNALATHDIESSLYGTSLGIDLARGQGVEHGHEHHIRALNTIRKAGSIRAAVESGVLTGGIMHALVTHDKHFVLVGSVRDDGPLPDVHTDVIEGQRAMRAALPDVGFCLMVATMLHSVATGNILPASIPLVCVDINPATVTKLSDRGSSQARGIVTDVGLFLEQLAHELVPGYRRS